MFSSAAIHIPVPKVKPRIVPRTVMDGDEFGGVRPNYLAGAVAARTITQDNEEGGTAYDYTDYVGSVALFGLVLLLSLGVFVARRYRRITRL